MSRKFIFMVFNPHLGHSYETKRNFKILVQETRPSPRARAVFIFNKKQMKSKNHKIGQDVKMSHVEVVVKN